MAEEEEEEEEVKKGPVMTFVDGLRENIKGFISDFQSRRMSMMATRTAEGGILGEGGILWGNGILKGEGTLLERIPRPLGIFKAPEGKKEEEEETVITDAGTEKIKTFTI